MFIFLISIILMTQGCQQHSVPQDSKYLRMVGDIQQDSILDDANFVDHLLDEFTVDTTEMFRDAGMWRMLRQLLLADSLKTKITIYIPFVSTGEELFSLLVLLSETGLSSKVNIIANHWSTRALNRVKAGVYNTKQNEVNLHNYKRFEGVKQLETYFEEFENTVVFRADLLANVQFMCEGLSLDRIDKQHLVLFRNSMLIYNKQFQEELIKSIDDKIVSGGILCIGVKELLPESILDRFESIDFRERIYRKHKMLTN